ncbi:hypothetical protein EON66_12485 [archaeon]|nr:MAG: hypothetical protein EON66_12485 [archaeon]
MSSDFLEFKYKNPLQGAIRLGLIHMFLLADRLDYGRLKTYLDDKAALLFAWLSAEEALCATAGEVTASLELPSLSAQAEQQLVWPEAAYRGGSSSPLPASHASTELVEQVHRAAPPTPVCLQPAHVPVPHLGASHVEAHKVRYGVRSWSEQEGGDEETTMSAPVEVDGEPCVLPPPSLRSAPRAVADADATVACEYAAHSCGVPTFTLSVQPGIDARTVALAFKAVAQLFSSRVKTIPLPLLMKFKARAAAGAAQ